MWLLADNRNFCDILGWQNHITNCYNDLPLLNEEKIFLLGNIIKYKFKESLNIGY
jgi:hypothetical protein